MITHKTLVDKERDGRPKYEYKLSVYRKQQIIVLLLNKVIKQRSHTRQERRSVLFQRKTTSCMSKYRLVNCFLNGFRELRGAKAAGVWR